MIQESLFWNNSGMLTTDLGYRTNFPIQDILLSSNDDFDLEK